MSDKVKLNEIVEAPLLSRIEAHGIEQPSIDALIAEIDALPYLFGFAYSVNAVREITDKYRGQK